jgi:hypothetical protein
MFSKPFMKTFEFLGRYIKFHEVDLAIISQFQYKHEATTYESFFDQHLLYLRDSIQVHGARRYITVAALLAPHPL